MSESATSALVPSGVVPQPEGLPGSLREVVLAGPGADTGTTVFGLVTTAVDGTVFDLAATEPVRERFATPSGGRYPQARMVTLVECGTRRVLAAQIDSCGLSEQRLWDRLAGCLRPGTLNHADRDFFSLHRWRTAAATGAHLVWRVKNGRNSLPATAIRTLPDGSHEVRLRESDAMLSRRRTTSGEKKAPRLGDITARLVEFTVTDEAGRARPSRFRVLTTLLDHEQYPAEAIAACYTERWQVELTDKMIKSALRGGNRRLRGQAPDLPEPAPDEPAQPPEPRNNDRPNTPETFPTRSRSPNQIYPERPNQPHLQGSELYLHRAPLRVRDASEWTPSAVGDICSRNAADNRSPRSATSAPN